MKEGSVLVRQGRLTGRLSFEGRVQTASVKRLEWDYLLYCLDRTGVSGSAFSVDKLPRERIAAMFRDRC